MINQRVIASKIIPLRIIIFSQEKQITFTKKVVCEMGQKKKNSGNEERRKAIIKPQHIRKENMLRVYCEQELN